MSTEDGLLREFSGENPESLRNANIVKFPPQTPISPGPRDLEWPNDGDLFEIEDEDDEIDLDVDGDSNLNAHIQGRKAKARQKTLGDYTNSEDPYEEYLQEVGEQLEPLHSDLIDVDNLTSEFRYREKTHLLTTKGSNGAQVVLPSYIIERRTAAGEDLFSLANRATIHPRHGFNPLETPVNEVLKPMALPYGERPSLCGELLRDNPLMPLVYDVIEPGNVDWASLYHYYVRTHMPASGPKNVSKDVHGYILGRKLTQYTCDITKMHGREPSKRINIYMPGWLLHMLPEGWRYWFQYVVLLGTMVNPRKVRQAYAIDSLPSLAQARNKRKQISLGLWKRTCQVTIMLEIDMRVREWAEDAKINDIFQAYVTAFQIGLGLPGALYGYLNSPAEWHPTWNNVASKPLQATCGSENMQQLMISLRHIDLIHSALLTYTPANKAILSSYKAYKRSRFYVAERMYEVLYRVPRWRVKIHSKPMTKDDYTHVKYKPVRVNRSFFLKTLAFSALCAQRDKSWVDLELDPSQVGSSEYTKAFIEDYIDDKGLKWWVGRMHWFVEGYRRLQVQSFVRAAICHRGSDRLLKSPYIGLLKDYSGGIEDAETLQRWVAAAETGETKEILIEVKEATGHGNP